MTGLQATIAAGSLTGTFALLVLFNRKYLRR